MKLKRPVRKPGEKKQVGNTKLLKLPQFPDPREPGPLSPLLQFVVSCGDEVPYLDAIHEFQQYWCDHPREAQTLGGVIPSLDPEQMAYTRRCNACGISKELKGRPPTWLERR